MRHLQDSWVVWCDDLGELWRPSDAHDSRLDGGLPNLETKLLRKSGEWRESIESFHDGGGISRRVQDEQEH